MVSGEPPLPIGESWVSYPYSAVASRKACFGLTFSRHGTSLCFELAKHIHCTTRYSTNRFPREPEKCRITQDILCRKKRLECSTTWCHARERQSVSSAALLGVMQGRDTSLGAEETSKTELRKFPRKSDIQKCRMIAFEESCGISLSVSENS